ncbi:hypothetical protein CKA55_12805 [Arcobacter suis]|uniref:Membrane protein n=1 Tax=Arcobacter suis CECT 7833 TaxID=663365 RepID=A0AAD0SSR7_9BACT|nr:hypothetical protein [Arcobacter suis]AXX90499.1 putative membrane protein [Arcobacter suis CECT 7833]RWS45428.1 hypothetical protein CKA55_12805 [Arcobacter suis]
MESIKDTILNIKGHLYERVTSPFLLTFIIVLFYYYWPVIFISFDDKLDSKLKIEQIKEIICEVSTADRIFNWLDYFPMYIYAILLVIVTMIIYSLLFVVGTYIREFQYYLSKRVKKSLDIDYVNSKDYADVLKNYENQFEEMSNKISNKTHEIQNFKKIIRLTEDERKLFYRILENNGSLDFEKLSDDEKKIMEIIGSKGICAKSNTAYVLTSNYNLYSEK